MKVETINNNDYITNGGALAFKSQASFADIMTKLESARYTIETAIKAGSGERCYEIYDKELGQKITISEANLLIRKDVKTGMELLLTHQQLVVTPELKNMLQKIAASKGVELKEAPLPSETTLKQDPKTGLYYLHTDLYANRKQPAGYSSGIGFSIIIGSKADLAKYNKLVDEFSRHSICDTRENAELRAGEEIAGHLKRGLEGFLLVYPDSIAYMAYEKENYRKSWTIVMSKQYYDLVMKALDHVANFESAESWKALLKGTNIAGETFEVWDKYDKNGRQALSEKYS